MSKLLKNIYQAKIKKSVCFREFGHVDSFFRSTDRNSAGRIWWISMNPFVKIENIGFFLLFDRSFLCFHYLFLYVFIESTTITIENHHWSLLDCPDLSWSSGMQIRRSLFWKATFKICQKKRIFRPTGWDFFHDPHFRKQTLFLFWPDEYFYFGKGSPYLMLT